MFNIKNFRKIIWSSSPRLRLVISYYKLNGDIAIFSRWTITEQIPSPISSHDQVPQSAPSQTFFPSKISSSQSTLNF